MLTLPIRREKLSAQVYDLLREMISNHRFLPGTRINAEALAKELNVSRTPVWEAIGRLEQQGFLVNIPNRGVFMAVLTKEKARQFYKVRQVLESLAGKEAAARIDRDQLSIMQKNLKKQFEVQVSGDLVSYSKLDYEFHDIVYVASGNDVLREMLANLKDRMRSLSLHMLKALPRLLEDHKLILDALENKDGEKASQLFWSHNQDMLELVEESQDPEWLRF